MSFDFTIPQSSGSLLIGRALAVPNADNFLAILQRLRLYSGVG